MTTHETVLNVSGMRCGSCKTHINKALDVSGVEGIDIQIGAGKVRIRHATALTSESLAERVTRAGYPSQVDHG